MSNLKTNEARTAVFSQREEKRLFGASNASFIIAVVAVLAIGLSGYMIVMSRASGFFVAVEPELGTLSGNAQTASDTTASGGKAIRFTAPQTSPPPPPPPSGGSSCALPKYPTLACTGVPAGTSLQTVGGMTITTPGQVIEGKRIEGNVDIRAHDVIIKNSEIHGAVFNDSGPTRYRFTLQDSTVIGSTSGCSSFGNGAVGVAEYTARRVRISGFPDGFRIAGSNVNIEDSLVTVCSANPADHSDGIQVYGAAGGTNIVIRHNSIDQRSVTNGAATSPIFAPVGANQGNNGMVIRIIDNLLAGGGYSLRVYGDSAFSAPAVTGNKIVHNSWEYGPVDLSCQYIDAWSGNATVTYDWTTGQIVSQVQALNDCN